MFQLFSVNLANLKAKILQVIISPEETFVSHIPLELPEELIPDFMDKQLQLTRKGQMQVQGRQLPALHSVDLSTARQLSPELSQHLYNIFHLCHCSGILLPEAVTNHADSTHRIYYFTPEGISFSLTGAFQENKSALTYKADLLATEKLLPTTSNIKLTGFALEQGSSLESPTQSFFNNRDAFILASGQLLLDSAFWGTCEFVTDLLAVNDAGTIKLLAINPVTQTLTATKSLGAINNSFPTRIVQAEESLLVFNGTSAWILDSKLNVLYSRITNAPILAAVESGFMGNAGFVLACGGSASNLTLGAAAGGTLEFLSPGLNLELKTYQNAAPTALLKDGCNLFVGVTFNNSLSIGYELYDAAIKLCDKGTTITTIAKAAFASFFVRSGKVYALVIGHTGLAFSPKLVDLELSQEISITSSSFTAPANWKPTVKKLLCELPTFDFEFIQSGGTLASNKFWSVNGTAPISSTYQTSSRLFSLAYDGTNYSLKGIKLKASSQVEILGTGTIQGQLISQNAQTIKKLTLIPSHNCVVPNIRLVRIQTMRPYQIPFVETDGAASAGTIDIYQNGLRYTFIPINYLATGFDSLGIWNLIERNGQVFGVEVLSSRNTTFVSSPVTRLIRPTAVSSNVSFNGQAKYDVPNQRVTRAVSGTNYLHLIDNNFFNVELSQRNKLLSSNQSWFRTEYLTKTITSFDCGVVLWQKNSVSGQPNQFTESYLPSVDVSAIEFHSDVSADNCTISLSRYSAMSKAESLVTALGTSDFEDNFEPATNSQIDILSFGDTFLTNLDDFVTRAGLPAFEQGISKIFSGFIQGVKVTDSQSESSAVGMLENLSTPYKDVTGLLCPYAFGGIKCGVALTKSYGVVVSASAGSMIVDFGAVLPLVLNRYQQGTVRFLAAGFQSVEKDIGSVTLVSGTQYQLNLFGSFNYSLPKTGTLLVLANGCTKTLTRCNDYGNLPRGRQMPYLQGARVYSASGELNSGINYDSNGNLIP
jgi:hypothetical protein